MQMSLFQDTSGIYGAIQGKEAPSGTPASLYAQQAQNASINTMEQMAYFENFIQARNFKVLKVLTQYYQDKRYLAISGRTISESSKLYDPDLVRNLDFDVVVTQGTDTPVYRQLIDSTLIENCKDRDEALSRVKRLMMWQGLRLSTYHFTLKETNKVKEYLVD